MPLSVEVSVQGSSGNSKDAMDEYHPSRETPSTTRIEVPAELIEVVRVGVLANHEISGSVALGGTICALFAQHRTSADIDFVVPDLRERFAQIREHLLELPVWEEARVKTPILILGSFAGIEVGYRQLRRRTPLETRIIQTQQGDLLVPTLAELLRIKAFLAYERNTTRDFVDFAELSMLQTDGEVVDALASLDDRYASERQPSILLNVTKALLQPEPYDRDSGGFESLRFLRPKLRGWSAVSAKCAKVGRALSVRLLGGASDET